MCNAYRFRRTLALVLMFGLQWPAVAGLLLGGTRVILGEKDRQASISVKNTGTSPYVVQTWVDAGEGQNRTPLLVTPPLSRLDPGTENILRVLRVAGELPADRESVFWLNVKEIPERSDEANVLQIAVRSRIKLFYRPSGLSGKPWESRAQLRWVVSAGAQSAKSEAAVLRIFNPTAYHLTLTTLDVNDGEQRINAGMVPPFGELSYPLSAITKAQRVKIAFATLNDYGGETPGEFVMVPVGDEPVVLKSEPVPALVTSASGAGR